MFLIAMVTASLTAIVIDIGRKRRAFLCQQVKDIKRR